VFSEYLRIRIVVKEMPKKKNPSVKLQVAGCIIVVLLLATSCGKKTSHVQSLTPTETVKLFYETLEKMPNIEQAKTDPLANKERKAAIQKAADLIAIDSIMHKAGHNPLARKGAKLAIAMQILTESLAISPDFQRIYHTEKIEGEEATVGFTLVQISRNTKTEHEIKLIKEKGRWRIAKF